MLEIEAGDRHLHIAKVPDSLKSIRLENPSPNLKRVIEAAGHCPFCGQRLEPVWDEQDNLSYLCPCGHEEEVIE